MSDSLYDKLLLILAQLAPVVFICLNAWYNSLTSWYIPLDEPGGVYTTVPLESAAQDWLAAVDNSETLTYIAFVDSTCPCSHPTLKKLDAAIAGSDHPDADLLIYDIADDRHKTNALLNRLIQEIPSVPMVLVASKNRLIYTGPVNTGSYCTTQVDQALPVMTASAAPPNPIHNWIAEGCYCRNNKTSD